MTAAVDTRLEPVLRDVARARLAAIRDARAQASGVSKWVPVDLHPKQRQFYDLDTREALYGGAAGGGKSVALLASALKYVDVPGYAAVIVRRSFAQLTKPSALIDLAGSWLRGRARWNQQDHKWTFPSGATLTFGYLEVDRDLENFQGPEFQFIGVDELTQIRESHYRYLFSRLRKRLDVPVPLRVRNTSNPGGTGHEWVKRRFFDEGAATGRVFIPAKIDDNPSLDKVEYLQSLANLDAVTRAQLEDGNWEAQPDGEMFKRSYFTENIIDPHEVPPGVLWVRFWDPASTEVKPGKDPDFFAGGKVGLLDGVWYIADIRSFRKEAAGANEEVKEVALLDGRGMKIRMEQEPGASGKISIDHYARFVLPGYDFDGVRATGSKTERARPLAAAAQRNNVKLVRGPWISAFLDQAAPFPYGSHDDMIDCITGGMGVLMPKPPIKTQGVRITGR